MKSLPQYAQLPNAADDVLYDMRDGVATITLNRPGSYNAYTTDTLRRLHKALRRAKSRLKAGLFDREHQIATLLQSAMLPRALPKIAGLAMSGSYIAASVSGLVGGDWYDAFQTANDRVLITVGDVMGHGLDAAVAMGKVRQALRVLARSGMSPVAIMNNLDLALHEENMQTSVTAFVGLLDPRTGLLEYSIAGHPPPLMRTAAGFVNELEFGDLPLGVFKNNSRSEHRLKLDVGSMLVLYTDGLTESSRNILEGEFRLRAALRSNEIATAHDAAESLRQLLARSFSDDVAILTVTRTPIPAPTLSTPSTRVPFKSNAAIFPPELSAVPPKASIAKLAFDLSAWRRVPRRGPSPRARR